MQQQQQQQQQQQRVGQHCTCYHAQRPATVPTQAAEHHAPCQLVYFVTRGAAANWHYNHDVT
jgi:hypothetical protein